MFGLFGKAPEKKAEPANASVNQMQKLNEQIEILDKKMDIAEKKANQFQISAKGHLANKNQAAAKKDLMRKKKQEKMIQELQGAQMLLEEQKAMLESTSIVSDVMKTIKETNAVIKNNPNNLKIEEIEDIRDELQVSK